jgi:hypothetical protein
MLPLPLPPLMVMMSVLLLLPGLLPVAAVPMVLLPLATAGAKSSPSAGAV